MDNPGQSTFIGGSLQLEGIGAHNLDDGDESRSQEEEEENRWREAELRNMMTVGFDDLKEDSDDESMAGPGKAPTANVRNEHFLPDQGAGGRLTHEGGEQTESYVEYAQHPEDKDFGYSEAQSSYVGYRRKGDHRVDFAENDMTSGRLSQSCDDGGSVDQTGGDCHNIPPQEDMSFNSQPDTYFNNDRSRLSVSEDRDNYDAANYQSDRAGEYSEELRNQYKEADTPHDQLKRLYEARGRELDRQVEEIKKLKLSIRTLQHEQALLKSEAARKDVQLDHLKSYLSDKEEQTRTLTTDLHDHQEKLQNSQSENRKLHSELEAARSMVSSLEIKISELEAADYLTRNKQLHEDFTRKLKQSNQEEKDLLLSKLEAAQKEGAASSHEVKRLRDEMRNMRTAYEKAVREKTETVIQHTVTVETMRKQYDELLQSHDSQKTVKLQLNMNDLETKNHELKANIGRLEEKLTRAEEELHGYEMALKFGMFNDLIPEDDSMNPLGIKKTLTYDDTQAAVVQNQDKNSKATEAQDRINVLDELKNCLRMNKAKRDEINRLREELHEKQDLIKKSQSAYKDACARIQEVQSDLAKLQVEHAECQKGDRSESPNVLALKAENTALHKELAILLNPVREFKDALGEFADAVKNWRNFTPTGSSGEDFTELFEKVEAFRKSISNIEEHLDQIRKENSRLHDKYSLWEKKLHSIQIQVSVSEKMIVNTKTGAVTNDGSVKTYRNTHEKLLEDLKQLLMDVKKEKAETHYENVKLQEEVTRVSLECEKLKLLVKQLSEEKANLASKKDEEKNEALESCRNTYMTFHEDAVRELKAKLESEYKIIAGKLKTENVRLEDELQKTKELYIKICHEKDEIEDKLNGTKETGAGDEGGKLSTLTVDSGVGRESQNVSTQQIDQYKKKMAELELELVVVKERNKEEQIEAVQRIEQLEMKHKETLKEIWEKTRSTIEELQKKCATLEECNQILKEECKKLEEKSSSPEMEIVNSSDHEHCLLVQERQKQQLDRLSEEKDEMIQQYESLIQDLHNKFTKTESTKLLEHQIAKQATDMTLLENRVKEQEKEMKSLKNELQRMKDKEGLDDRENEEEVRKLTDIIQNLEGELRERQEENQSLKIVVKKTVEEFKDERERLTENLQKTEAELAALKEVKKKYNSLKQKITRFQDAHKEQIARLTDEYQSAKDGLLEQVKEYVEKVRDRCFECVRGIITTLRGLNIQLTLDDTVEELEQVIEYFKNFTLRLV